MINDTVKILKKWKSPFLKLKRLRVGKDVPETIYLLFPTSHDSCDRLRVNSFVPSISLMKEKFDSKIKFVLMANSIKAVEIN